MKNTALKLLFVFYVSSSLFPCLVHAFEKDKKNNAKLQSEIAKLKVKIAKLESKNADEESKIVDLTNNLQKEQKTLNGMKVASETILEDTPEKVVQKRKLEQQMVEADKEIANIKINIAKRHVAIAERLQEIYHLKHDIQKLEAKVWVEKQ